MLPVSILLLHVERSEHVCIWKIWLTCFGMKPFETVKLHTWNHFTPPILCSMCVLISCSCWCLRPHRRSVCATEVKLRVWTYFVIKRWKSVMQSLINTSMIRNIELLSDRKSHRAPCLATAQSNTALLFLQRNVNFSPDRFISAHFRWIVGPGSALPSHPLSSSPLGPIRELELKINETRWQNSVYFKTSHLIWRSLSDLKLN